MSFNREVSFWDEYGLLHSDLGQDSENGPLFSSYYYMLLNKTKKLKPARQFEARSVVHSLRKPDGTFSKRLPHNDVTLSHDNMTGILCLSKLSGTTFHRKGFWTYRDFLDRMHPRDLVFYTYLAGGFKSKIAYLFLWITSLSMIVSCLQSYKTRGGQKILKTDGKLLAYLRFNTVSMPITERLCTFIIQNKSDFGSWKNCFKMYFKNYYHPCNELMREIDE